MKKFAEQLLKRRKELRKSRNDIADEIRVSSQTIWKWEKNLTAPDADEIVRIAKALRCSAASLFGESLLPKEVLTKPDLVLEAIRQLRINDDISLDEVIRFALIDEYSLTKAKKKKS